MAKSAVKKVAITENAPAEEQAGRKSTVTRVVEQPDRLIPAAEARERLGLKERQEQRQIAEGRLQRVKIGRLNFYRESHIEDVIANGLPE